MMKHAMSLQEDPPESDGAPAPPAADHPHESLEQRVQRLEDAVASLQDTRPLEDRIFERVSERLAGKPEAPSSPPPPPPRVEYMVTADRRTAPPPADGNLHHEPPRSPAPAPFLLTRHPWLLYDLFRELRAMVRMFFDVRYHVGWSARVTVLILLPLIFTSYYWVPFSSLFIVGTVIEKTVDILLAFLAYKALSREARRYLEIKSGRAATTG